MKHVTRQKQNRQAGKKDKRDLAEFFGGAATPYFPLKTIPMYQFGTHYPLLESRVCVRACARKAFERVSTDKRHAAS